MYCRELKKYQFSGNSLISKTLYFFQSIAANLKNEKGELHGIKCDLSKESDILSMFDQIKKQFGRIDVCINNAGLTKPANLLSGATEDWKTILDVC